MPRRRKALRAAAILSSLVLVTGFVAYRTGLVTLGMSSTKSTFMFVSPGVKGPPTATNPSLPSK